MKISRKELRAIIAETVQLAEASVDLPKEHQGQVKKTANSIVNDTPPARGRFSATVMAKGESSAEVEVDGDTTVSSEHKEKLAKALRLDGVLGFSSGDLDKSKTYKYVAALG